MRPWLCDILACPIDKFYPLELIIFSYETSENVFKEIIETYEKRDIISIKNEDIIVIEQANQEIFLKDEIVIQKSRIDVYIKTIISSIKEVDIMRDQSSFELSKKCIHLIQNDIKQKIKTYSNNLTDQSIDSILPELYFLNKFKTEIEIESGLLFCPKCKRWFPIIETIPQMLPDEYRDKEADILFLKTNKDLLDNTFLKQNLKPYNL
ncbi:MAG: Trm112 family protein [Promethearchaeota archaeon]